MKNLKKFSTSEDYNTYITSSGAVFPNVSLINGNTGATFNPVTEEDLTFSKRALHGGSGLMGSVKGNTVVWNQLFWILPTVSGTSRGVKVTNNFDGTYTLSGTSDSTGWLNWGSTPRWNGFNTIAGHKYYISINRRQPYMGVRLAPTNVNAPSTLTTANSNVSVAPLTGDAYHAFQVDAGKSFNNYRVCPQYVDLTAMGLDYITTADEFERLFPSDYYAYSPNRILNFTGNGAVRLNQIAKAYDSADWVSLSNTYATKSLDDNNKAIIVTSVSSTSSAKGVKLNNIPWVVGHKYYIRANFTNGVGFVGFFASNNGQVVYATQSGVGVVGTATSSVDYFACRISNGSAVGVTCPFSNIMCVDLTFMFGEGLEPSAREFEEMVGNGYLEYHGLEFNLWDEKWENGTLDTSGNPYASSTQIRSANYTPVEGGETYYIKSPYSAGIQIYEFTTNKAYINRTFVNNTTFKLNDKTRWIKFRTPDTVTSYTTGITINLSDPMMNGTYMAHVVPYGKEANNQLPVWRGFNLCVTSPQNMTAVGTFPAFSKDIYTKVQHGVTYYLSHSALSVSNWRHLYKVYDINGNEITENAFSSIIGGSPYYASGHYWVDSANNTNTSATITFAQDGYVIFGLGIGGVLATTPMPTDFCLNIYDANQNGKYLPYQEPKVVLKNGIKTTGRNIFDEDGVLTSISGVTKSSSGWTANSAYWFVSNGTENTYWKNDLGYTGRVSLYWKGTANSANGNFRFLFVYTDGSTSNTTIMTGTTYEETSISTAGKVVSKIQSTYGSGRNITIEKMCITLYDLTQDGSYEPYRESIHPINSLMLTSGGAPVFPDGGMNGMSGVCDTAFGSQANRRYDIVDLGSLSWIYTSGIHISTDLVGKIKEPETPGIPANVRCDRYVTVNYADGGNGDMCVYVIFSSSTLHGRVYIKDSNYIDPAEFKKAVSGVKFVYELTTPITYTLDNTVVVNYHGASGGIQTLRGVDTPKPLTGPITCNIVH